MKPSNWSPSSCATARIDLVILAGGRLPNEDLFNLRQLTDGLGGQSRALFRHGRRRLDGPVRPGAGIEPWQDWARAPPSWSLPATWKMKRRSGTCASSQAAERGATLDRRSTRAPTKLDRRSPPSTSCAIPTAMKPPRLRRSCPVKPGEGQRCGEGRCRSLCTAENLVIFYGSEGLGLAGSPALAQACAALLAATDQSAEPTTVWSAVWPHGQHQGAWDMGFRPAADLAERCRQAKSSYIAAADPAGDDPAWRRPSNGPHSSSSRSCSSPRLPGWPTWSCRPRLSPSVKARFTSGERRVQRFYPARPAATRTAQS